MSHPAHPFTCNTCQVAFRTSDLQRTHMQSDWHRYNLKRKVASLPPLASEVFAEKVLANKANAVATAARASFEKACEACDKTYYSQNAYVNHLGSQKHKLFVARLSTRTGHETESMADSTFSLGDPIETASTTASTSTVGREALDQQPEEEFERIAEGLKKSDLNGTTDPVLRRPTVPTPSKADGGHKMDEDGDDEDDEVDEEHQANFMQCLFCNYLSPTKDLNLHHMSRQHGFFIPERDYVVDLPGLVTFLSETIHVLHQCLFCHKLVHTASGVQTHMRDRGHCMIAYATEDEQMELGEFYDFSSTYSDEESEDEKGGVSLGVKRTTKTTTKNQDGEDVEMDGEEEGWESDSTLSSVPTDEITSIPVDSRGEQYAKLGLHRHHSHNDARPHKNTDGYHSHAHHTPQAVYHDDYELHLPSGRTAGHRSLRAYYRQNLRNYPSAEERAEQRTIEQGRHDSDAEDEESEATKANGRGRQIVSRANGGTGMIGVSEAKKREVRAVEKREKKREQRARARYQWGNDRGGNFQKHFRDPLLQ